MSGITLLRGEFKEKLDLLLAPQIKAGFPSPADDYLQDSIDFNRDLVLKHPRLTPLTSNDHCSCDKMKEIKGCFQSNIEQFFS